MNNDVIKEKRKEKYILYKRKKGSLFLITNIETKIFLIEQLKIQIYKYT